jgi:hypothetical protein
MLKCNVSHRFAARTAALAAILSASLFAAAQDTTVAPAPDTTPALFSSSITENAPAPTLDASLVQPLNFANYMQYGGGQRARYGRPRYRGANTNADGSSKYTFFAGVGLGQPIGNTWHYLTPSYAFQAGFGRQFNKNFALPIEFDYDHFGFTGSTLANQTYIYNSPEVFGSGAISGLDGSSHVWSFSLDPTYTFLQGEKWGAYGVAGAGFFHKTANFTIPATGTYCDYYYGCYQYSANETIDKYTSNAPGFSGGFGITYKFSRFSNERFYAEARYVFVADQHKTGFTVNNVAAITATSTNLYPANSNRTTYFPIKVGVRF